MCTDWDEEEHTRLVELGDESFFDSAVPDHTKDSGYGNAERSYRSQEVWAWGVHFTCESFCVCVCVCV